MVDRLHLPPQTTMAVSMTASTIRIRRMEDTDMADILRIQTLCYPAGTIETRTSLCAKLAASQSTCFVADDRGDTLGYLIALPWECANPPSLDAQSCRLPGNPDCLYLHDLAVVPCARRSGAARGLVEAFFARLADLSLTRACLIAVQGSSTYWVRHGFQVVHPTPALADKLARYGEDVCYMTRVVGQ